MLIKYDYVTLMLINMTGGLVILAWFVLRGLGQEDRKHWAPAFGLSGAIAAVTGFVMIFTWPLPNPYNIPYGEMSVLLGLLFLAAAWALARGWGLMPIALYAIFAGAAAILIGVRVIQLELTQEPHLSGLGFILTGAAGVLAALMLRFRRSAWLRVPAAILLLAAASIWAWTGYTAYWWHLSMK